LTFSLRSVGLHGSFDGPASTSSSSLHRSLAPCSRVQSVTLTLLFALACFLTLPLGPRLARIVLPFLGFFVPSTFALVGSDLHRLCLRRLCCVFRFSQPLDALFRLSTFGLVSCRNALGLSPPESSPGPQRQTPLDVRCPLRRLSSVRLVASLASNRSSLLVSTSRSRWPDLEGLRTWPVRCTRPVLSGPCCPILS
jgi:hypothetical protein